MRYLGANLELATYEELEQTYGNDIDTQELDPKAAESVERYHLNFVPSEIKERCRLCANTNNTACCEKDCELFERAGRAVEIADREVDPCFYCPDRDVRCDGLENMKCKLNMEAKQVRIKNITAEVDELVQAGILSEMTAESLKKNGINRIGNDNLEEIKTAGVDDLVYDRICDYLFGKASGLLEQTEKDDRVAEAVPEREYTASSKAVSINPIRKQGEVKGLHIGDFTMTVGDTVYTELKVLRSEEGYDNPYYGFLYGTSDEGVKRVVSFKAYEERIELSYDFKLNKYRKLMQLAALRAVEKLNPGFDREKLAFA